MRESLEDILESAQLCYAKLLTIATKSNYPRTTLEDCLEPRFDFRCNLELATQC